MGTVALNISSGKQPTLSPLFKSLFVVV